MAASIEGTDESEKPVLQSLSLPEHLDTGSLETCSPVSMETSTTCALCDELYEIRPNRESLLKHLLIVHKLVIADVNLISNFKSYLLYWRQRFKEQPLTDFCSLIETTKEDNSQDEYYLLSDVLPEDKQLREFLQKRKLEWVLAAQQRERDDESFSRNCLFCREHFTGNRALLFNHMAEDHAFNVGQPDNLVFTTELLDRLESKLTSFQCLFCEKTFRDRTTLKEHMRKKQHRKINPKNKDYDQFYVINYLELGKNWEVIQQERDLYLEPDTEDTDTEDEWSGWEEEAGSQAICLYCDFSTSNPDKLQLHMQELHDLDLQEIKLRLNLNFYQQVKLVNYIRRQVHLGICVGCQERYGEKQQLQDHMHQSGHCSSVPDIGVWDQPQYFFPTYENDNLLCQLEDADEAEDSGCHGNIPVIAEDGPATDASILCQEDVRKHILHEQEHFYSSYHAKGNK